MFDIGFPMSVSRMQLLLFYNPDRFLRVSPCDQAGSLLLVAAAVLVAGPPDDDAVVGIKACIGAPKRVDLRVGKAQVGNLRPGIVQNFAVPVVPRSQTNHIGEAAPFEDVVASSATERDFAFGEGTGVESVGTGAIELAIVL